MVRQVNRGAKSADLILPAPIAGLNARDSLGAMSPNYAIRMDNYIPMDNKVALRSGYSSYVKFNTENKSKVETLVAYNKPNDDRMIAICGGSAYNVSSPANVSKYEVEFVESRCQTVQYKNYLYFLNGIDTPKAFYIDDEGVEHFEDWKFTSET